MKLKRLLQAMKHYSEKDQAMVYDAYELLTKSKTQKETVEHSMETAHILVQMKLDPTAIVAGLLHEADITAGQIRQRFGEQATELVNGIAQLNIVKYETNDAESLRKMIVSIVKDIRVLLIKLADILQEMRTLRFKPKTQQLKLAQSALDIYAPLAYRLGLANVKWEMEDIAFKYLKPEVYERFKNKFGKKRWQRELEIRALKRMVENKLGEHSIKASIIGRPKHFYSIYKKMITKNRTFDELYDIIGMRIITNSVRDCYEILGILHNLWKPIHGEFDDYIAMPKSNMYQSLHTTVVGPNGQPVEIQIRTEEMDRIAEDGIAAHWCYKGVRGDKDFDKKLGWLKQVLEWQQNSRPAKEFMEFLKIDFFEDEIYVFTPKGDVISLPKDSTPIDFAYGVHSSIGDRCFGAIVNGRIVPLRARLNNGDIVRILTSKRATPHRDWLKIVKTTKAKARIKQHLRITQKVPAKAITRIEPRQKSRGSIVEVKGLVNPKIRLAKCCHPLPNDKILGYPDKTNRIVVHSVECENLGRYRPRAKAKVAWVEGFNYQLTLNIIAHDRVGLFADILNTIAAAGTNINPAKAKLIGHDLVECTLGLAPENLDHLRDIINRIKSVKSVTKVFLENE